MTFMNFTAGFFIFIVLVITFIGLLVFLSDRSSESARRAEELRKLPKRAPLVPSNMAYVAGYTFPAGAEKLLEKSQPSWTPEERKEAWEALRQFFLLAAARKNERHAMPSLRADLAWRAFLADSVNYEKFCKQAFGRMLHHHPDPEATSGHITSACQLKPEVLSTWKALREESAKHPASS